MTHLGFDGFQGPNDEWVEDASCRQVDAELFYPEKGASAAEAKSICRLCPVQAECLVYAIEHDERFGVWGGKSERERRQIRRAGRR